ncbi:DNA-binding protein YbiB [Xylophilus rhododendri]|uniref:DNA-binding protein YbiB n=1 Tax=Xylophilus rhododendri TaxID=2697032 RepID=A0A857JD73_9BURK|nr:DNA-binding protein YbiB [Xylophilus rhododendri]QHJ01152.1 DNA-binding protein YbiB [Xylophilus rhododendri]
MAISHYIKEIGRGARGARPLDRAQAADLFGQVLDGSVTDLEIGAFCLAMRIKGETSAELAGFLDATAERSQRFSTAGEQPIVVLPSYNGARRMPVLTPLLALLVARAGLPVLVHGSPSEDARIGAREVFERLGIQALTQVREIAAGEVVFAPTEIICPGLKRLLDVRRVVGLRNPAHSVVKLMNPCAGPALLVASYTHPAYAESMAETFALLGASALLSRGLEGEVVADPRRTAELTGFRRGAAVQLQAQAPGTAAEVPGLPADIDADSTAAYTRAVLDGRLPLPEAIARQLEHLLLLARSMGSDDHPILPAATETA